LEIEKAREMGFCFGVRRAINILKKAARQYGGLETLGATVHNQQVVAELAKAGVQVTQSLDDVRGNIIAIASHGVGEQVMADIEARGLQLVDTTCPIVRSAQMAARELAAAGFSVIVFGDAGHPEVKGVLGWTRGKGMATLGTQAVTGLGRPPHRLGILSQTTQSPARFAEFVAMLVGSTLDRLSELRVVNTICGATRKRQAAALELAGRVDLMVVVGGRTSANTIRLTEMCAATGVGTYQVESADEVKEAWLKGRHRVGVTAGASTPNQAIDEVVLRLDNIASDTKASGVT
jgi:4-hydroxy-3-methylbut-2-enyl diphosphate reductase